MSFEIDTRVETEKNGKGRVAFFGPTQFADGDWVGVILDEPKGKNNGTVQGVAYFNCDLNFGLFIRPSQLKLESGRLSARSSALKAPTTQLRKESAGSRSKLSPGSSPGMSPAVSTERLTRSGATSAKKSSSGTANSSPREAEKQRKMPSASRITEKPPTSKAAMPKVSLPKPSAPPPAAETEEVEPQSPSVMSRVKKMEESSISAPPLIPSGMNEGTELEYLRVEVKDLNEKLETLRYKRKEDHAKLVDYERAKIQLQALNEYKQKTTDAITETQRQLQEARRETVELREWRDANQQDILDAQGSLEMAAIDKEMAEEKAEALEAENERLKEQLSETETNLEILKEEMALDAAEGGTVACNSVQTRQLEQQNERLKEALIKLRDANGAAVAEKQEAVEEAERLRAENSDLFRNAAIASKRVEEYEREMREFQEAMDANAEAEQMVEALSSKNLDLEDKVAKLEQDLEDLEALRDMDEQIAETQKQVEKDLLKEIEAHEMQITELRQKIRQEELHAEELSDTIIKFRKRTCELNEEIQELKDQCLRYEEQLNIQRTEDTNIAGMVNQMQLNANKNFTEMVESAIKTIELDYSLKHVAYLKAFLPDNFAKAGGDNDAVILTVLFPRLAAKAKLFSKLAAEKYPGVPGGIRREHITKSHKADQWAHCAKIAQSSQSLVAVSGQFESAFQTCTMEQLSRVAQLQPEMTAQERAIDQYLDLLKQGRLDENTSLDNMDKAVTYFQNVFGVHMGGGSFDACKWLETVCQQMLNSFAWWKVNAQRVKFFLVPESEESDVAQFVKQLFDELAVCEQLVMQTKKRIPTDRTLKMTPQFTDDISSALVQLERIVATFHEACSLAAGQISLLTDIDGLSAARMKEMFHAVIEKVNGSITMEKTFEPYNKYMWTLRESLKSIQSVIDSGNMEVALPEKKPYPPMLERAIARKQAAVDAEGLKWQLEKKDGEILDLKRSIKARIDDVSNYKLRLEMSEKRVENSGKAEGARVAHLETMVDQLVTDMKKKQIEFDEALDAIQKELVTSERENTELRERAKNMSKKALLHGIQAMDAPRVPSSPGMANQNGGMASLPHTEVAFMEYQLGEVQQQLKYASEEIAQLKADNHYLASSRAPLSIPLDVSGPETLAAQNSKRAKEVQYLDEILDEAYKLKRDELRFAYFMPDSSKPSRTVSAQRERWESERKVYLAKIEALRARAHTFWHQTEPGKPIPKLVQLPLSNCSTELSKENITMESKVFKDVCSKWGIKL